MSDQLKIPRNPSPLRDETKTYLGDGVYAAVNNAGMVVLTAENGIEATDTIYLEPAVCLLLAKYLANVFDTHFLKERL